VAPEAAVAGEYEDALADVVDLGLDSTELAPSLPAGLFLAMPIFVIRAMAGALGCTAISAWLL